MNFFFYWFSWQSGETPIHDEWLLIQNIDIVFLELSASLLSFMFASHGSQHIPDHLCLPSGQLLRECKLVPYQPGWNNKGSQSCLIHSEMNYKCVLLAAVLENSYYLPISLTPWKIGSCLPGEVNTKRIFRNPTTQVVHISEKAK